MTTRSPGSMAEKQAPWWYDLVTAFASSIFISVTVWDLSRDERATWPITLPIVTLFPIRIFSQDTTSILDTAFLWVCYTWIIKGEAVSAGQLARIFAAVLVLNYVCNHWKPWTYLRGEQTGSDNNTTYVSMSLKDDFAIPPLLIPARTTHSRFVPKKHSFSYSYFYVGIPVGWSGCRGSVLSADVALLAPGYRRTGWFDVNSDDYLSRDANVKGLDAKLRQYLHSQGVSDDQWSFAYLCTAPRFLGYSFNPVSFWYIYNAASELAMMILEVNNTFDERRIYLLRSDDKGEKAKVFKQAWPKDFHVSPFNSRKGAYSLRANSIIGLGSDSAASLDNTITLKSSKDETKLVARVFSEGAVIDPASASSYELFTLVRQWCWVGFITFPRILYEAYRLFFTRKLHVWYRPEVLTSSIGRRSTPEERKLEQFISGYFFTQIKYFKKAVIVTYTPPLDLGEPRTWTSDAAVKSMRHVKRIDVRVLSPAFYSRFVHYLKPEVGMALESSSANDKIQTISVSAPDIWAAVLQQPRKWRSRRLSLDLKHSLFLYRGDLIRLLRCPPAALSYEEEDEVPEDSDTNTSQLAELSPLDCYVSAYGEHYAITDYQDILMTRFLAQRFTFGFTELLLPMDWVFRLVLVVASMCTPLLRQHAIDHEAGKLLTFAATLLHVAAASLVHLWSVVKRT